MFKKKVKGKIAAVLAASLVLQSMQISVLATERGADAAFMDDAIQQEMAGDSASKEASGVKVAYHTQDEIREYIAKLGATETDPVTFQKNPVTEAPFSLGRLSDDTLDSAIRMLNQIRYVAGISYNVSLNDSYIEMAQAASLVNYVNNKMTHYPEQPEGMSDEMFQLANKGAGSSNIAWGSGTSWKLNHFILLSWMEDGDDNNIDRLGHRRWLLNPTMEKTGFGFVNGGKGTHSAVYAFDRENKSADEYGVMWPAQNMPTDYFNTKFPWSVSMGTNVDISKVHVTLTRKSDGQEWKFSQESADGRFYVNNDSYGQKGCIIFRPNGVEQYSDGDSYDVYISGLTGSDVSYTVNFFDLASNPGSDSDPQPTVESVKVYLENTNTDVAAGGAQQFKVVVDAEDGADTTVTWSVSGNKSSTTSISQTGLLTVAEDEEAATLTVKAVSKADTTKSAQISVNVLHKTPDPGTETPGPGTETPEPGTEIPDPGTETPEPGTEIPDPGTETPDPGTEIPAPGTETPEPDNAQKVQDGSFAYFQDKGADDALNALTNSTYAYLTQKGDADDATSFKNMLDTIQWIKECNQLREQNGLNPLLVTDELMAMAQADANYSDTVIGHAQQFNIGENCAWNFGSNPFTQWYDDEKAIYDKMENPGWTSETGHYLNIINPAYTTTGFAINTRRTKYPYTYVQVFSYGNDGMTVEEYEEQLLAYYHSIRPDSGTETPNPGTVTTDTEETKTYTVTFMDGSTELKTQTVENKTGATAPAVPTKEGYSFTGWDKAFDNVTSDLTVNAKWKANTYKITYDVNGGSKLKTTSKTVTYDQRYGTLAAAERVGYTFSGWYTAKTGGAKIAAESTVKITADTTLYAHWSKVMEPAKVKKPTVKNSAKKTMKVSFKKVSGAAGYEIRYSTKSSMKNAKKITTKKTSATIKKLTKGKTYYVQVRAYKRDSAGKKVYSKTYSTKAKTVIKK